MNRLFVFGLGYSAAAIGSLLVHRGWKIAGTFRSQASAQEISSKGFSAVPFDAWEAVEEELNRATHLLLSVPPNETSDPVLCKYESLLQNAPAVRWVGYLSTIGVYGDYGGAWVDENTAVAPATSRGAARVKAENLWRGYAERRGLSLDIFRLAGIYGPDRSPLDRIREGTAKRVIKPGQVFNRIHVEDIARTVVAAIEQEQVGLRARVFNVTDDEPAPPQDVLLHAARLIGAPEPPAISFEQASLSAMARSFYEDNKRVKNDKIKQILGIELRYPTYREGLLALAQADA